MPELVPLPFAHLITRLFQEYTREQKIYDLQSRYFWRGTSNPAINLGGKFHGRSVATLLGPAAGPQTQLAQNIVLSFLGGCRIMELKTVQINDELLIPRPCIDATNVGYNIEFSQELRVAQSLEEYVKAWMLIRMIEAEDLLGFSERQAGPAPFQSLYECCFDLSCGYDLGGIKSQKVQEFIRGLQNASPTIEKLRAQIPPDFRRFRDIEYNPEIVSSATLSTFHNCPPHEIEAISDHLLRENRLNTIVKMNPTMLGEERLGEVLNGILGYTEIKANPLAFAAGLQFDDSIAMMRRLRKTAHGLGLSAGAKFSNTLEVINHRDFFPPSEQIMYMSGAPLHPITLELALTWRKAYLEYCRDRAEAAEIETQEDGLPPISFSAGVDKHNFSNCIACGFVPVTTCTDLLKPGGYNRTIDYLRALESAFASVGAADRDEFIMKFETAEPAASLAGKTLRNHEEISLATLTDARYHKSRNSLIPKRIQSHLVVFDCLTCDKCIPVCPNDANFTYSTPETEITYQNYTVSADGTLQPGEQHLLQLKKARQIANFAGFCNECGNCDTFCPEYGGPFIQKPTFFSSFEHWKNWTLYDGFFIRENTDSEEIFGRIRGADYYLKRAPADNTPAFSDCFQGPGYEISVDSESLEIRLNGPQPEIGIQIDLQIYLTLRILLQGVLHDERINYVNTAIAADRPAS
jgi:putative selenate reductase